MILPATYLTSLPKSDGPAKSADPSADRGQIRHRHVSSRSGKIDFTLIKAQAVGNGGRRDRAAGQRNPAASENRSRPRRHIIKKWRTAESAAADENRFAAQAPTSGNRASPTIEHRRRPVPGDRLKHQKWPASVKPASAWRRSLGERVLSAPRKHHFAQSARPSSKTEGASASHPGPSARSHATSKWPPRRDALNKSASAGRAAASRIDVETRPAAAMRRGAIAKEARGFFWPTGGRGKAADVPSVAGELKLGGRRGSRRHQAPAGHAKYLEK